MRKRLAQTFPAQVLASPPAGAFVVLFKTPQAATLAARSCVFPQRRVPGDAPARGPAGGERLGLGAFKVRQAPGPEDMLWQVRGRLTRGACTVVCVEGGGRAA